MIVNAHRSNVKNIGDLLSSPLNYFNFKQRSIVLDIHDEIRKIELVSKISRLLPAGVTIIVGGGGLLDNEFFEEQIHRINKLKVKNIIYWGVGHNKHKDDDKERLFPSTKEFLDCSSLYGVRDKLKDYNFLPCVSCMHPQLESKHTTSHDIVIFEHEHIPIRLDFKAPRMRNNHRNFSDVIAFLGSANYVITNSYHGMYWSILMGKKVVCIPFSSKFELFPFETPMGSVSEIESLLEKARVHESALEICRTLNKDFYRKVIELI